MSHVGLALLKGIAASGKRIFTITDVRQEAKASGFKQGYIPEALYHLRKSGWIRSIKRGVYAFTASSGFGTPPHDYEIAMALATPAAISHWTALYHHHLTQQIPQTIFVLTPTGTSIPRHILTPNYHFIQIKREHYFGISSIWIEEAKIDMTDPERTLLDGLMTPQFCGGIQEVLGAFEMIQELNVDKIIDYALRLNNAAIPRLGWVLETICNIDAELLQPYVKGVRKLDASAPEKGFISHRWKIQENIA